MVKGKYWKLIIFTVYFNIYPARTQTEAEPERAATLTAKIETTFWKIYVYTSTHMQNESFNHYNFWVKFLNKLFINSKASQVQKFEKRKMGTDHWYCTN